MSREMKDSGIEWIGEIPVNWKIGRLKNVSSNEKNSIVDGPFGSAINTKDYVDIGVPLIRITNIKDGSISTESMVYITPSHAKQLERSAVKTGDIIIAKTGATVGKCAVNESVEYGILSSSCIKISINKIYNNKYFYYLMNTSQFKDALINSCNGTTRDTINLSPFSNLNILIPEFESQLMISHFLDQKVPEIDNIIEKTSLSIEEYKRYKQSLITEAVTKGLNPNAAMKDSGIDWIGEIPSHWKAVKLKYLASKIIDGTHSTPNYVSEGIPFLRVTDITVSNGTNQSINMDTVANISFDEHQELIKRCYPQKVTCWYQKTGQSEYLK